jgi:uncharacterized membrane protein
MKRWLILTVSAIVLAVTASLVIFINRADWLPENVPTHWGVSGQPDRFTSRDALLPILLLPPGLLLFLLLLGLVLPWLSPVQFKIEPFAATYYYIFEILTILLAYLHVMILAAYLGWVVTVDRWIIAGLLLMMILLGNVLGKVRRNFWVGVRTPWTLASEVVWTRTHRLAAWLFVLSSLLGLVLLLTSLPSVVALIPFLAGSLAPVVYSLILYKSLERQGKLDQPQPLP